MDTNNNKRIKTTSSSSNDNDNNNSNSSINDHEPTTTTTTTTSSSSSSNNPISIKKIAPNDIPPEEVLPCWVAKVIEKRVFISEEFEEPRTIETSKWTGVFTSNRDAYVMAVAMEIKNNISEIPPHVNPEDFIEYFQLAKQFATLDYSDDKIIRTQVRKLRTACKKFFDGVDDMIEEMEPGLQRGQSHITVERVNITSPEQANTISKQILDEIEEEIPDPSEYQESNVSAFE
jgi:hypothetical protein